jgi:hypothetical protein
MPKYNPFRPNSIVGPGMFSGRYNELLAIEQSLRQTSNGNPKHFLIEGERGISKSSLMYYVQLVGKGAIPLTDKTKCQFLVLPIELSDGVACHEIIRKIAIELRSQLVLRGDLRALAKSAWDFITNWSILGVEYKRDAGANDPTEVMEELARTMADIIRNSSGHLDTTKQIDGILILIDEADKPNESAKLGEFVKLLTERLTKLGCEQVCLGLAGLPSLIPKLRASHESSPRVFDTLTLPPIGHGDCKYAVLNGLTEANNKNQVTTNIADDALTLIARLSDGYPHFIQQFSFSAFNQDTDNVITVEDVELGAYKPNGALDQLGKRYFDDMYYVKVWSVDYRRVLHAMTDHLDGWVSRSEVNQKAGIKPSQVNNALNALKKRNIIIANPQRMGEYRLPTKSFAVWLKGVEAKRLAASHHPSLDDLESDGGGLAEEGGDIPF